MEKGQSFHIASSKGCHYSGLTYFTLVNGFQWNWTVQPRGPLKGNMNFGLRLRSAEGVFSHHVQKHFWAVLCHSLCQGSLPPQEPWSGKWPCKQIAINWLWVLYSLAGRGVKLKRQTQPFRVLEVSVFQLTWSNTLNKV